jgi:hypothetical protein
VLGPAGVGEATVAGARGAGPGLLPQVWSPLVPTASGGQIDHLIDAGNGSLSTLVSWWSVSARRATRAAPALCWWASGPTSSWGGTAGTAPVGRPGGRRRWTRRLPRTPSACGRGARCAGRARVLYVLCVGLAFRCGTKYRVSGVAPLVYSPQKGGCGAGRGVKGPEKHMHTPV